MEERYKKYFKEDAQCDCEKCDKKESCNKKKQESIKESAMICESCRLPEITVEEDCPYKPASNGMCANATNDTKLKGKCQGGWQWSSKDEKCYKVADTKK